MGFSGLNTSEFEKAMMVRIQLTHRDASAVLNDRAGDVCMRAIQYTPRAAKERIESELKASEDRAMMGKRGKLLSIKYAKNREFKMQGLVYALINLYRKTGKLGKSRRIVPKFLERIGMGKPLQGAALIQAARAFVNKAISSIAYIAAGWVVPARALGKRPTMKFSEQGMAARSFATKATPERLTVHMENWARGALAIGAPALQQAVNEVARDMQEHDAKKILAGFVAGK